PGLHARTQPERRRVPPDPSHHQTEGLDRADSRGLLSRLMFPYDPQLLDAVSTPPAGIADVIRTMQTIDSLCIAGDGLHWFTSLHLQVTHSAAVRVALVASSDPAWMPALAVQFADLYFAAWRAALSAGAAPGCWRPLFDRRDQTPIARIQFALAGVNA